MLFSFCVQSVECRTVTSIIRNHFDNGGWYAKNPLAISFTTDVFENMTIEHSATLTFNFYVTASTFDDDFAITFQDCNGTYVIEYYEVYNVFNSSVYYFYVEGWVSIDFSSSESDYAVILTFEQDDFNETCGLVYNYDDYALLTYDATFSLLDSIVDIIPAIIISCVPFFTINISDKYRKVFLILSCIVFATIDRMYLLSAIIVSIILFKMRNEE